MNRIAPLVLAFLVSVSVMACSGDESSDDDAPAEADGPLDCALIEGPNCYNQMITGLSCVPPEEERGVLSADRTSCDYADGTRVIFLDPAPSTLENITWHFALEKNGARCFEYEGLGRKTRYTSGNETTRLEATAGGSMDLTCSDGKLYRAPDAFAVLDCATVFGSSYQASPDEVSFSFIGLDGAGRAQRDMFDCAMAQ
jgi:hypothetical protein